MTRCHFGISHGAFLQALLHVYFSLPDGDFDLHTFVHTLCNTAPGWQVGSMLIDEPQPAAVNLLCSACE